jgi:hypothetical protein
MTESSTIGESAELSLPALRQQTKSGHSGPRS